VDFDLDADERVGQELAKKLRELSEEQIRY